MLNIYFVLREHFKEHDYPFDLLNEIMITYHQASDFVMFDSEFTKLLLAPNGDLYSWKDHGYRKFTRNKFVLPPVGKVIKRGQKFYILAKNGNLYSWTGGLFYDSHILSKVKLSNVKDIACNSYNIIVMTKNGDIYILHYNNNPIQIEIFNAKSIFCNDICGLALTEDNKLYSYNFNDDKFIGRLDRENKIGLVDIKDITEIICLQSSVIVKTQSCDSYTWGYNKDNCLGVDYNYNVFVPEKMLLPNIDKVVFYDSSATAITLDGHVYEWGGDNEISIPQQLELSDVKDVVYGSCHRMALTHNGDVYCWGSNDCGQLGLGHFNNKYIPQKVEISNIKKIFTKGRCSFAISNKNELYAWGYNKNTQLGLPGNKNVNSPQKAQIDDVKDIFGNDEPLTIITTWSNQVYYCGRWYGKGNSSPKKLYPF